jgi:hypothetical protein
MERGAITLRLLGYRYEMRVEICDVFVYPIPMKNIKSPIAKLSALFLVGIIGLAGCGKKDDGKKITIKSPAGDVQIEKKGDDSIKVQDAKGGFEISAKAGVAPSELTVKAYPHAQIDKSQGSIKVETPQGTLVNAFFVTNDKPADVMAFYSKEIKSSYTANIESGGTIVGKTLQGNDITVNIKEQGGVTKIYVQEMKPKK